MGLLYNYDCQMDLKFVDFVVSILLPTSDFKLAVREMHPAIVLKRLKLQGFVTFDWHAEYPEAVNQIAAWIKEVLENYQVQRVTTSKRVKRVPFVLSVFVLANSVCLF